MATFLCADETVLHLPRKVLHRSSLLLQALADSLEQSDSCNNAFRLPCGMLDGWVGSLRAVEVDVGVPGSQRQWKVFNRFHRQQHILKCLQVRF